MIYEKIDLYDYFSVPRNGSKGGELTVYVREKYTEIKDRIRPAMLVIAGGGYNIVSERESEPVALEFLHAGFSAFSLRYSVNTPFPAPLLEAGMAMAFIRENAEKYSVDRAHVGAIGFSQIMCLPAAAKYGSRYFLPFRSEVPERLQRRTSHEHSDLRLLQVL